MSIALICLLCLARLLPAADPAIEVRALLDAQVASWNRGDLAAFLEAYRHAPDLTFYSNGATIRGFEAVRKRFQDRYGSAATTMGKLAFEDLEISALAPDVAFVRGRFRLQGSAGPSSTGLFSLLLRKAARWEIVHDHTSVECAAER